VSSRKPLTDRPCATPSIALELTPESDERRPPEPSMMRLFREVFVSGTLTARRIISASGPSSASCLASFRMSSRPRRVRRPRIAKARVRLDWAVVSNCALLAGVPMRCSNISGNISGISGAQVRVAVGSGRPTTLPSICTLAAPRALSAPSRESGRRLTPPRFPSSRLLASAASDTRGCNCAGSSLSAPACLRHHSPPPSPPSGPCR